jgi:cation:H+ antiporter
MSTPLAVVAFALGALVSLATSWVLVTRIERIGGRLGATEAMLGLLAALAADTPEISSAVSALAHHQESVGVGVVLGSNVFNLAALLGMGAVVAGRIVLHRRVVALEGVIGIWIAVVSLLAVVHALSAEVALALVLVVLVPYAVLAGWNSSKRRARLANFGLQRWLDLALAEEEVELSVAIHPRRGRLVDFGVASGALVVVVTASVVMERSASTLGRRFAVPDIVVGTLVLAGVTSLPNAVAAVYLARRGRGAATWSTALNSNALNVAAGLLIPAVVLGMGPVTAQVSLVASWYVGLTVLVIGFAYIRRGLPRSLGALILAAYAVFAVTVVATASRTSAASMATYLLPAVVILAVSAVWLIWPQPKAQTDVNPPTGGRNDRTYLGVSPNGRTTFRFRPKPQGSLLEHWSVRRVWLLALLLSSAIAACDALLGQRLILMGLLIVGPCCALLAGRWLITLLTGAWVLLLAVFVSVPDGIWATATQAAFLAAIAVVSATAASAAAIIERHI